MTLPMTLSRKSTLFGLAAATLLAGCMSSAPVATPTQYQATSSSHVRSNFASIHQQQNIERAKRGLSKLRQDRSLMAAAAAHARDMSQRNFYSHFAPDGGDPMDRVRAAGGCRSSLSENIAKNWKDDMKVFWAWMASPKHYKNMMDGKYTRYGVGSYNGYYVMVYAGPCV